MPFTYTPVKLYVNCNTKSLVDSQNSALYSAGSAYSSVTLDFFSRDISQVELRPLDVSGNSVTFATGTNFTFVAATSYTGAALISVPTGEFGTNTNGTHSPTNGVLAFNLPFTGASVTGALGNSDSLTIHCAVWQYPTGQTNPSLLAKFDATVKNATYPA